MHGWCAEKENRGGFLPVHGSSWDAVRTRLGTNFACSGTTCGQSGSSQDPVGHQCREAATFIKNSIFEYFCRVSALFLLILAASRQVQTWGHKFENWCPIGSRLDSDWPKVACQKMQNRFPTTSRVNPEWLSSKNTSRAPIFQI